MEIITIENQTGAIFLIYDPLPLWLFAKYFTNFEYLKQIMIFL